MYCVILYFIAFGKHEITIINLSKVLPISIDSLYFLQTEEKNIFFFLRTVISSFFYIEKCDSIEQFKIKQHVLENIQDLFTSLMEKKKREVREF